MCTLSYVKQMTSASLMQKAKPPKLVLQDNPEGQGGEGVGAGVQDVGGTHVYLWLIHADVWQKASQYCNYPPIKINRSIEKNGGSDLWFIQHLQQTTMRLQRNNSQRKQFQASKGGKWQEGKRMGGNRVRFVCRILWCLLWAVKSLSPIKGKFTSSLQVERGQIGRAFLHFHSVQSLSHV